MAIPIDPAARDRPVSWRRAFVEALGLAILMRVVLGLVAGYVIASGDAPGPCHFELALDGWITIPRLADHGLDFGLLGVWQRWDACWYGKIATYGYEPGTNATVFFPLTPLLVGLTAPLVGGSVALAGYLVSFGASVVGLAAMFRLVGRDLGIRVGRRAILYLSVFPSAFFLVAPFSEAAFLASSVLAILGARERRPVLAGVTGFLAGLGRLQGVFLVLPIAWETVCVVRDGRRAGGSWDTAVRGALPLGLAAFAPVVAFGLFVAFAYVTTGISPFEAQDAWGGRDFHAPWDVAVSAVRWGIEHSDPLQFLNLSLLTAFIAVTVLAARRLPFAYTLWAAPQLAILSIRLQPTPLTATNRYVMVVFPVFAALALWGRNRWVDRAILIASTLGLGLLAAQFARGEWVA